MGIGDYADLILGVYVELETQNEEGDETGKLPNGNLVEKLQEDGKIIDPITDCNLDMLCMFNPINYKLSQHYIGLKISDGVSFENWTEQIDPTFLQTALSKIPWLTQEINKYGFEFKPEDIQLHHIYQKGG